MPPTPFTVSTITAVATVSTGIDIARFFSDIEIVDDGRPEGFASVELARKGEPALQRGDAEKFMSAKRRRRSRKKKDDSEEVSRTYFDNQVTVVYITEGTSLNMKVFKNGGVQMTGIKRVEYGRRAVEFLEAELRRLESARAGIVADASALRADKYRVCLINSDFKLGFAVRRENLHNLMRSSYAATTTFEPCIYRGVKIQYMWNASSDVGSGHDGGCACMRKGGDACDGKGFGGKCRKVTIAVFQSGTVIITGAHTLEQVQSAYDFIVHNVVKKHEHLIAKDVSVDVSK